MQLESLTRQVTEIAKQAGDFIRQERKSFSHDKIEYKGLNDMVSYVDKNAERIIVSGLENILPEAGFITEEKTTTKIGERYNWIIDPLDGTTNFIHGVPTYSVSIALKEFDELISGVVYEINLDECFYAWKDAPAYLNGAEIRVSNIDTVAKSLVATGFPYYNFEKQAAYMELFTELMRSSHGLRRLGSAAVDLVYTACGRFETFYEYNLNAWDVAAGALIVERAGGKVSDFSGGKNYLFGKEMVAASNGIYKEFQPVVSANFLPKNP